ncbi:MAG: ABC transporter substrate-binding protein [Clostridia bacterium]|nr:ABC transporter substrate-binding protein [Clostridia bacterium]
MKKLFCLVLSLMLLLSMTAFAEPSKPAVRLAAMTGPTAMGLVKLLDDAEKGLSANQYDFLLAGAADEISPSLIQGKLDIASIPVNLAAILNNKTNGGLTLLAVNTLGVIYIVEKGGESIQSLSDLKGKTLYATGKGSTPEYNLTYLLKQAGLTLGEDVIVEWKSEPAEVVALMSQQEEAFAMLPQPFVTVAQTKVENLRVALNLTEEWDALQLDSRMITSGIVVRTQFLQENPEAVENFLKEFAASAQYANESVPETAALIGDLGIVPAPVAEKALPFCNIVCLTGEEMQTALSSYLQVLYDLNPASVGGALPADSFYYVNEESK